MKKIIKCLGVLLVVIIVIFGSYLFRLRSLAKEANEIFGLRCTKVHPPLIGYKNSFLKMTECFKNAEDNPCDSDEVVEYFENYIMGMRLYVPEETAWLEKEKELMDSWKFKLFAPAYLKQAAEYQWKMYEGYRDDAKYMIETFDTNSSESANNKFEEARKRRDEYRQKYYEFTEEVAASADWRMIFTTLPFPEGCTEEILTIPETSGSLDWGGDAPEMINPIEGPVS